MILSADKNAVTVDLEHPWIQDRLAQVERRFPNFLTSPEGRLYLIFGGARAGKTILLEIIRAFSQQSVANTLSVYIDLAVSHALSSSQRFFELLFEEMCRQYDVCYPKPKLVAGFFRTKEAALPDFKEVFEEIVGSKNPRVQGARFLFLLDNAEVLCPFVKELFEDLNTLFLGPGYSDTVARQIDIVMTGSLEFYRQISELKFPNDQQRYNLEVLPPKAARAFVETLSSAADHLNEVAEVLRLTGRHPYLLGQVIEELRNRFALGETWAQETLSDLVEDWITKGMWEGAIEQWFFDCAADIETHIAFVLYARLATRQPLMYKDMVNIARQQMLGAGSSLGMQVRQALDILMFYGLVEQSQEGMYTVTSDLFKRWFVMTYRGALGHSRDTYTPYEVGMADLLAEMTAQHPRYDDALVYQQRLTENIDDARTYGDTNDTKSERARILRQINVLAQEVLGKSLVELD